MTNHSVPTYNTSAVSYTCDFVAFLWTHAFTCIANTKRGKMVKSKPLDSEPKHSGSKRKKLLSSEQDTSVDVDVERKVKKKKAKTNSKKPITVLSDPPPDEAPMKENAKKRKQPTEQIKEKKKKKVKFSETTRGEKEEMEGEEEEMEGEEDLSPEERRVLERKMKKILKKDKKNILKMEGKTEETHKPIAPQQALDYLSCWSENRKDWKFQKTRQTWLLQHMFDTEKVPDQSFSVLLQYLEGLRGAAKDTTVQKAEAMTREHEGSEEEEALKITHRAREVIQLLS